MWHRLAAVAGLVFAVIGVAPAQQRGVYSNAVPPPKAALDRLNLRTEWTAFVPVEGNRDTLAQIQTVDDQVFVQTRAGLLVALDALTGRPQWSARLGNGSPGVAYPVAANGTFVYCAHVTKLYAFYRYSGAVEFVTDLGTPPTAGLAADDVAVFCVLGVRPGSAGGHRVAVYDMPRPISVNEPVKGAVDALAQGAKPNATSPVDDLLKRYSTGTGGSVPDDAVEQVVRPRILETPVGGYTGTKSPSLTVLPSVAPPYVLDNGARAPSLNVLPSLRQPYKLRQEAGRYVQQTPSLGVIPPSIAASLALSDLRPKGVSPPLRWEYGISSRILYPLLLTPTRAWGVTADEIVLAFNKQSEAGKVVTEVSERLTSPVPAPPAASGTTHYVPLANGSLLAVNATSGNLDGGLTVDWRANPGGLNNHTPFVTKTHLYASGDNTGVVCLNRTNGDLVWRSDPGADRVVGANDEFVYVRDRQGRFLVYDAKRATDPARHTARPLGAADFSTFNLNVINTASDRVYLAADNGLIVCLRDANPKYAKPVVVWPPAAVNRSKVIGVETFKKGGTLPEPKKEPENN